MSSAYGIKAIKPTDAEHVLGFASARSTTDDALFEIWNGSSVSALVLTVDKDGQVQAAAGTVSRPSYSFEADKDTGIYYVASGTTVRTAIGGADVVSVAPAGVTITGTLNVSGELTLGGSLGLHLGDNELLTFGAAVGTPDFWLGYSSSGSRFEFVTTNANGSGTDGVIFYVGDTVDDVVFTGNITAVNVTASGSLVGTLSTAAQGSVTSVGTLTALTVSGAASFQGATTIGNASGDALTIHPAAWTLSNAVTVTGTWANLGAVTTVDINGGTVDGAVIGGAAVAAGSFAALVGTSLNIAGDGATVTGIKDEDNMASNSATKLATQQSIVAYVTAQITAEDLDVSSDSGTIAIDLNSATLTIAGGTGIDTSATSTTVTITGEAASLTNAGIVEIATAAETNTGTDATRAVSPDGLEDWTGSAQVTTLGTIATGTWSGVAIAANKGGTGQTTYTVGDILYATGSTAVGKLTALGAGKILRAAGTGAAPAWTTATFTSTYAQGTLLYAATTNAVSGLPVGSANKILTSNGTIPAWETTLPSAAVPASITLTGDLVVQGDTDIGNATSDTLSVTARIDTALVPSTDGVRDLGTSSLEWKDLFIDGTANIDALVADTADINAGTVDGASVGANSASTGAFTSLTASGVTTLNGNTTIGNASGDALTFHPGAWTLTNAVTITGTWANLGAVTTVDINGGAIDGATVGANSASTGAFTTLSGSGVLSIDDTTQSTSTTTGSIHTDGGLGVVKDVFIGGDIAVAGTGPHAIGGAASANNQLHLRGTFSAGAAADANALEVGSGVVAADGTWSQIAHLYVAGTVITQDNSETIANVASVLLREPNITKGSDTVTNASTLKIVNAPDEGTNNYGLWVAGGATRLDGTLAVATTSVLTGNVGIGTAPVSDKSLKVLEGGSSHAIVELMHNHASAPRGMLIDFSGDDPNDRTYWFARFDDSSTTRTTFWSDGGADFAGAVAVGGTPNGDVMLTVHQTENAANALKVIHTHASGANGISVDFTGGAPNNRTRYFTKNTDSGATKSVLWSDGGATFEGAVDLGLLTDAGGDQLNLLGSDAASIEMQWKSASNANLAMIYAHYNGDNSSFMNLQVDGSTYISLQKATLSVDFPLDLKVTGNVGIGASADGSRVLTVQQTAAGETFLFTSSHSSTPQGFLVDFSAAAPDNRTQYFMRNDDSAGIKSTLWSDGGANFAGDVRVGTTIAVTTGGEGIELKGDYGYYKTARNSASSVGHWELFNSNGEVGNVYTSGTSTSFNTSSDYRLKENESPLGDALDLLGQLKPYTFNFKITPDEEVQGFFAHEVAEIVAQAVTGEKDAVDDDGAIKAQSIDHSHMVPLLVAAIQELSAKVEALEASN